jgi:hypothetical protein
MSYADQRGQLRNALVSAGLSQDAAANIANILANSAQDSLQSGRTRKDTTPDGLRLVGPDDRKHVYQNLDFRAGDPDHRQQRVASSEQDVRPQPAPNVTENTAPQQTSATYRVSGGNLSDASGAGDSVEVGVRSRVAKQPPGRLPITMLDKQSNTLVGKELRTVSGGDDGRVRFGVGEGPREVGLSLQLENISRYRVITGIEYEPGVGLRVQYSTISAWDERNKETRWLHMTEQRVVTEIVDDLKGPRAHTAYVPTFRSRPRVNNADPMVRGNLGEDLFFNLVRIGTFTGGWAIGATKTITQVWPAGGRNVTVMNQTQAIADTSETKYVLFVARTEDEKAAEEVRGEDENPIPKILAGSTEPVVAYYAIEIQHATECIAFSSLNGKRVQDLTNFDGTKIQALTHDIGATPCLSWQGEEIDVITDVQISGTSVVFKKRPVYVLKAGTEVTDATLNFTSVTAVEALGFDGTNLYGTRNTFYALSPAGAANTSVPTYAASALEDLSLGGSGLYSNVNTLRVFQVTPAASITVPLSDVQAGQCITLSGGALTQNSVTFRAFQVTPGSCTSIPTTDCPVTPPAACDGPCTTAADCAEGCDCVDGYCAETTPPPGCTGTCETSADCPEGCNCVDNQCTDPTPI